MRAAYSCFARRHRVERFDQRGIERGAEPDRLGKARPTHCRLPVQALFMKHDRNSEPTVLDEELLNGIRQLSLPARVLASLGSRRRASGIARPADLTETMTVRERSRGLGEVEVPARVDEHLSLLLPDAHHLGRFLLEGHTREEIADALLGGRLWRLVRQLVQGRARAR